MSQALARAGPGYALKPGFCALPVLGSDAANTIALASRARPDTRLRVNASPPNKDAGNRGCLIVYAPPAMTASARAWLLVAARPRAMMSPSGVITSQYQSPLMPFLE